MVQRILLIEHKPDLDEDLREIGLHSIASITLLISLEEAFKIQYQDEELLLENFATIEQIVNGLELKMNEKARKD